MRVCTASGVVDKHFLSILRKSLRVQDKAMEKPKRLGRPIKAAGPGRKVSLGLKVTSDIKGKLDNAAMLSGRTQSQEAEFRLEQSFAIANFTHQALVLAYGPTLTALILIVAKAMSEAGGMVAAKAGVTPTGFTDWSDNPIAFDQAVIAANALFEAARPSYEVGHSAIDNTDDLGIKVANSILDSLTLCATRPVRSAATWLEIRHLLGAAADRIDSNRRTQT
jgi:hypothetical protein